MHRLRFVACMFASSLMMRLFVGCVGSDPEGTGGGGGTTDATPGTDGSGPGNDSGGGGGEDGGGGTDGSPTIDSGRCDKTKPFDEPINVPNVNSSTYDNFVTLTEDEQTMYLSTDRNNGGYDIYVATWSTQTNTFAIPQKEGTVNNNGQDDRAPTVSANGNRLYFRSNRSGSLGFNDIWTTERSVSGAAFPDPAQAQNINGTADDVDPSLQFGGQRLYFASDREGGGAANYQIYESVISGGTTQAPTKIDGPGKGVRSPVISADGLTLYYMKGGDIYASKRTSPGGAFPDGQPVTELNSPQEDAPGWISPDDCVMYLISGRANGMGSLDVWMAKRPK